MFTREKLLRTRMVFSKYIFQIVPSLYSILHHIKSKLASKTKGNHLGLPKRKQNGKTLPYKLTLESSVATPKLWHLLPTTQLPFIDTDKPLSSMMDLKAVYRGPPRGLPFRHSHGR